MTLTGAPDLLNSLEPTDIELKRTRPAKAGVHEIPLQITLPNFINRTDQDRPVIKIELKDNSKPVTTNPGTSNNEGTDKDKPDVPGTGTGTGNGTETGNDQGEDPVTPPANEGTDNSGSGENPSHPPGDGSSDGTTGTETSNDG